MKIDRFMQAMLAAIVLALLFPHIGGSDGPLHMRLVTDIGIGLVFFLHGAETSREALHHGARNWRLHALIHGTTFLFFPLIGLAVFFGLAGVLPLEERQGFFYLCVLPSTISSSVAMTGIARGNVPAAIFAATTSGLAGMVLTPLLFGLAIQVNGHGLPLGPAFLDIFEKLLAPFLLGHLVRPWMAAALHRHKKLANTMDRGVVVLIVYGAFCDASLSGAWVSTSWVALAELLLMAGLLLLVALTFTTLMSRLLRFSIEDQITAVFCGSKKSLANGAPIARALLGAYPHLAILLLPLILYHQEQLLVGSILARRYAARDKNGRDLIPKTS